MRKLRFWERNEKRHTNPEAQAESGSRDIDASNMMPARSRMFKKNFWTRVRELRPSVKLCLIVIILLTLATVFAEWVAPYDPYEINLLARNQKLSLQHVLGTDYVGRDTLSRTIFAIRTSVGVALIGVFVGTLIGTTLGISAGLFGGWTDRIISAIIDFFYAIPNILIVLVGIAVFGTETWVLIALISFARWHSTARIIRGQVFSIRELPSVEAALALGSSRRRIAVKHILPNLTSILVVDMTLKFPAILLLESSLSFLGLGVQPPLASLGAMVGDGRDYLISSPLIALSPALVMVMIVMCFQVLGDWIRDVSDVRQPGIEGKALSTELSSTQPNQTGDPLLEIRDLHVKFVMDSVTVMAVNGANLNIKRGETVCIVGETGAGKSVTAFSVVRLLGAGGVSHRSRLDGDITFRPEDGKEYHILSLDQSELQSIRGRQISMIYQEPMTSLNPVYTCGNQIAEVMIHHAGKTLQDAMAECEGLLKSVGISDPKRVLKSYPHELSGGMKQRVMIAMALALHPALLIADEPTTAIDVTIQAQILNLFQQIQRTSGTSILYITHDVSVVAQLADRVVVMYAGRTVESGAVYDIFRNPLHPYTRGLLNSIPKPPKPGRKPDRLQPIQGTVPNPADLPAGCPFHPRCKWIDEQCRTSMPTIETTESGQSVMCWHWRKLQEVI